tara:strand:- start:251 stop:397 length:147 start_codon:yes stop_codon:yes gene_type:complete
MKITVLGKMVEKPNSILEMVDALILKAEKGTLSCSADLFIWGRLDELL